MATQQNQNQPNQNQPNKTQAQAGMSGSLPAKELEAQNRYWREHFQEEPYYQQGQRFDAYEPAYKLGMQARGEYQGKQFSDVEDKLRQQYEAQPQAQRTLDWTEAKQAARAAWDRSGQSGQSASANQNQNQGANRTTPQN